MTKTANYQLNQWEATDKLSRADFNSDNAAIDAALASKAEKSAVTAVETALANYKTSNDSAVANKADASALTALTAALGSGGYNLRVVHGSYTGSGTYGASNPVTLTAPFYPVAVICGAETHANNQNFPSVLLRGINKGCCDYNSSSMVVTWRDTSVSYYSEGGSPIQNNGSGSVYFYVILGYSK